MSKMNENKKAVILARGLGTRMKAPDNSSVLDKKQAQIAGKGIKTLIPIAGEKTLLDFIFESLSRAGFTKICLVIGDEHGEIKEYCRKTDYDISFAIQEKPLGTANAVLAAENFSDGEPILTVNSDNIYPINALSELRKLDSAGLIAFDKQSLIEKSNIDETKINKFAVLEFDEENCLKKIVEKPEFTAEDALISMNAWMFSPRIFEACRNIEISPRGEYELADAVNYAVNNLDEKFRAVYSREGVLDLSSRTDISKVREKLTEAHL